MAKVRLWQGSEGGVGDPHLTLHQDPLKRRCCPKPRRCLKQLEIKCPPIPVRGMREGSQSSEPHVTKPQSHGWPCPASGVQTHALPNVWNGSPPGVLTHPTPALEWKDVLVMMEQMGLGGGDRGQGAGIDVPALPSCRGWGQSPVLLGAGQTHTPLQRPLGCHHSVGLWGPPPRRPSWKARDAYRSRPQLLSPWRCHHLSSSSNSDSKGHAQGWPPPCPISSSLLSGLTRAGVPGCPLCTWKGRVPAPGTLWPITFLP